MSDTHGLPNHELVPGHAFGQVRYELKPVQRSAGGVAEGLYSAWITLDNPQELNSYTTHMVKDVILAFRRASQARDVVATVFTGAGDRAFCTGGNTREYAEVYAGRPEEYRQYMRLFNDMVSAILECDKPVICRVNGMRIGGGQEIGMACDFSIASDLARFGQAGPKHGSAPDGGSTDFLPLFVGVEHAMWSCTVCDPWSAYEAQRLGLIMEAVPVLRIGDRVVPNPMVETDAWLRDGQMVYGKPRTGDDLARGKAMFKEGTVDLTLLDERVEAFITGLSMTMPGCLIKTVESVRKHKLEHWDRNRETNRAWLGLNMMTEANLGFRAFHHGSRGDRDADFIGLRQRLAAGEKWGEELIQACLPASARGKGGDS